MEDGEGTSKSRSRRKHSTKGGSCHELNECKPPRVQPAEKSTSARGKAKQVQQPESGAGASSGKECDRGTKQCKPQYCTQKCLLGLVSGGNLDNSCPNVGLHRAKARGDRHGMEHGRWLELVREQLRDDLDGSVCRFGNPGATGVAFQITLAGHGYTFVGKGTVEECIPYLQHEVEVYGQLKAVQGRRVPVFLGEFLVDERETGYMTNSNEELRYFILMSWGGCSLKEAKKRITQERAESSVLQAVDAVHSAGVKHADVRKANVVWNEEGGEGRAMLIDFERSEIGVGEMSSEWLEEDIRKAKGLFK